MRTRDVHVGATYVVRDDTGDPITVQVIGRVSRGFMVEVANDELRDVFGVMLFAPREFLYPAPVDAAEEIA